MKIKYISAKNFLAVQDGPFQIDFTKYGDITQIKGQNLDYGSDHSNGSGKTSIIECMTYALYGKLIKGLSHKDAVNVYAGKGLEVEIWFDDYRIVRKREPNELRFWKDGKELTLGGIPATQNEINDVIGLTYDSFVNVACFGQHNERNFLRCTPAEKRSIAENLLSLDKYNRYSKTATERRKAIQDKLNQLKFNYETMLRSFSATGVRLESLLNKQTEWKLNWLKEVENIENAITNKQKILQESLNVVKKNNDKIIEEIELLDKKISESEKRRQDFYMALRDADKKVQSMQLSRQEVAIEASNYAREIAILQSQIHELEEKNNESVLLKGTRCPACFDEIEEHNVKAIVNFNNEKIAKLKEKINELTNKREELAKKVSNCDNDIKNLIIVRSKGHDKELLFNEQLASYNNKRIELSRKQPTLGAESLVIEKDITILQERLNAKRKEIDPFVELIDSLHKEQQSFKEELRSIKTQMDKQEGLFPYCEFWIKAFGDAGIRTFVLDEIMPALNDSINFWLEFLIERKIRITFDNRLEERIERFKGDGYPFIYNALSGGEHQRIDLAISLAFAHVMMLTSGTCPSLVSLDEVGTNLDRPGIEAVYRTICELAKNRQVLVTTHHPLLQELLSPHDVINVVMENGVSRIQ